MEYIEISAYPIWIIKVGILFKYRFPSGRSFRFVQKTGGSCRVTWKNAAKTKLKHAAAF